MKRNPYSWRENIFWFVLGACVMVVFGSGILYVVGETVEHFTP